MPLKRLKGMQYYGLSPEQLFYENNTLRVARDRLSIRSLFNIDSGTGYAANSALDNVFQLGWDSVALLEKVGNGFRLMRLTCYPRAKDMVRTDIGGCGVIYNQVVTRAVDTCTFVMLKKDNRIVMAHLDAKNLTVGLEAIQGFMGSADGVSGICSYLPEVDEKDGTRRIDFSNELKRIYSQVLPVERKDEQTGESGYFGHFEIGIYFDGNDTALYGDVIRMPLADFQAQIADSYLFHDEFSLLVAVEDHMRKRDRYTVV